MKPTDERYTPKWIVEYARAWLEVDCFDLDPASCPKANETVQARNIYTKEDDGLMKPWWGHIWLNWPSSQSTKFARKLADSPDVESAAIMLFNWDHSTEWFRILNGELNCHFVLFPFRIKFPDENGKLYEVGRSQALAFYEGSLSGSSHIPSIAIYKGENP